MQAVIRQLNLKYWADQDKPREKLMIKGKSALTDSELIAILLGTGNREEHVLDVAQRILRSVDDNLDDLAKMRVKDLMEFKGIGQAKAISIAAALELGRRRQTPSEKCFYIKDSGDVYTMMHPLLADLSYEEFWVILLNRSNKVMKKKRVSSGGVDKTLADTRMIFGHALEHLASSIVLCHNHPSGSLRPSLSDVKLTKKMKGAGQLLDIKVMDHVIVTEGGYYSFADDGKL